MAEGNFEIQVSVCCDSVALPEIITPTLKYGFLVDSKIYIFFGSLPSLQHQIMTWPGDDQ